MASQLDYQTIYEIFRACRLCGAGGGYKMPIVQSGLGFECSVSDVALRQKIRECVQIEVREQDKMPPLICELCIDKVNDFYEFLEMCRQTNQRTRARLGLPPQAVSQGAVRKPDNENCILGVTEPVYVTPESSEPKSKPGPKYKPGPKSRKAPQVVEVKREIEDNESGKATKEEGLSKRWQKEVEQLRMQNEILNKQVDDSLASRRESRSQLDSRSSSTSSRASRSRVPTPPPARETRASLFKDAENVSLNRLKKGDRSRPELKTILKRDKEKKSDSDDDSLLVPVKRTRDKDQIKLEVPSKKVKLTLIMPKRPTPSPSPKPGPKSKKRLSPSPTPSPKPGPKSKKRLSPSPTPSPKPGPKSKKRLSPSPIPSPKPGPKSKKRLSPSPIPSPKPGPKSKKRLSPSPIPSPKPGPKSKTRLSSPPHPARACAVCSQQFKTPQGLISHMRLHLVGFSKPELACNACGEWFQTPEETTAHHKKHTKKKYHCRHCSTSFKLLNDYDDHITAGNCRSWEPSPDVQCPSCWRTFLTETIMGGHKCSGADGRPRKCGKCERGYSTIRNLKRHEKTCKATKKEVKVDPKARRRIKPAQVRVARCDSLLRNKKRHIDVSSVSSEYGLDKNCVYPYIHTSPLGKIRIKKEPLDVNFMVSIKQEIKEEFYREEDYVHWDSNISSDSNDDEQADDVDNPFAKKKKVDSLTTLSLKTIFSKRCLGKVPRKLRKVKSDKLFDSLFANENECENDIRDNINNIIDNLGNDDNINVSGDTDSATVLFNDVRSVNSDSLLEDQDKSILGSNADFDLLLQDDKVGENNDVSLNNVSKTDVEEKRAIANGNDTDASAENDERNSTKDVIIDETCSVKNKVVNQDDIKARKDEENDREDAVSQDSDRTELGKDKADEKADRNEGIDREDAVSQDSDRTDFGNSQVSDKTDLENVSQNGDVTNDKEVVNKSEEKCEKVNGQSESETDIDDRKLLEELDAQIGESDTNNDERGKYNEDKILLEDLGKDDPVKSMELDSISDEEFNFDI